MTIDIYPQSPPFKFSRPIKARHDLIETDEFSSGGDLDRILVRFPKRIFSLSYLLSISDRDIIQNFIKLHSGWLFWFIDSKTGPQSKKTVDEYVGQGGPLEMLGAVADDGGVQTNEIIVCNNPTVNGMTLLPAVPAVNDAYYFGGLGQCDKATVIIGTQGAGTWTIIWEYWNGASWASLSGVTDGTSGFKAAAGSHDVTFTVPVDWVITAIKEINAYWIRARVSAYTSITTQPKGSGATINSKIFDLHGKSCTGVTIYVDGVAKTGGGADYTFVSGGGAAGADRIAFGSYPAVGSLITSDFTGDLRIKGKSSFGDLKEEDMAYNRVSMEAIIKEVQW